MRDGERLVIDGQPVFMYGVNAHYLLNDEVPEAQMASIVRDLFRYFFDKAVERDLVEVPVEQAAGGD